MSANKAMIVNLGQVQHDLTQLVFGQQERQISFPPMVSSGRVWVYSQSYILGKFAEQWKIHKAAIHKASEEAGFEVGIGRYIKGSGMCDLFTREGVLGLNRILLPVMGHGPVTHESYKRDFGLTSRLGDLVGCAFEMRFQVPSGVSVNGITDGYHSALLVGTTRTGSSIDYFIYEGQNDQAIPLHEAIRDGIKIWYVAT